jgi:hypothetical protein
MAWTGPDELLQGTAKAVTVERTIAVHGKHKRQTRIDEFFALKCD